MAGAAILNVSHSNASDIDAAVAMAPYGPDTDLSKINHPTLIIVGANDAIASARMHSAPAFRALNDNIPAAYATLPYFSHISWRSGNVAQADSIKTLLAAWFRWAFYDDQDAFRIVQNPPSPIRYNETQNLYGPDTVTLY